MQTHDELVRFRAAMDMSGDAIYLVDRRTMRFDDVNLTACTRMGYSREELLQMGPQDLLTASREEIERVYDEVMAAGTEGTTTESSARRKDGTESTTELQRRAQLEQALAEHGLGVDAVFHGHRGVAAIGISIVGRKLVCASAAWRDLYALDAILEAWARKLPQGDFSIGISVPGRVSGRPYAHDLIVTRAHAVRWADTLGPCLGERLKVEGLG